MSLPDENNGQENASINDMIPSKLFRAISGSFCFIMRSV